MDKFAGEQSAQSVTQPTSQPGTTIAARLFSVAIVAFVITWVAGFVFISRVFGLNNAIALSFISVLPFIHSSYMRCRWKSLNTGDWGLLMIVLAVTTLATMVIVGRWYESGWHYRPGTWTFIPPESEEYLKWTKLKQAARRDPRLRSVEIKKLKEWFVSGKVETEADFQSLISLATKCGLAVDESRAKYWRKYVTITDPSRDAPTDKQRGQVE